MELGGLKAKEIAFASYGEGDLTAERTHYVAHVSVDLDDDEAAAFLRRAPDAGGEWRPAAAVLDGIAGRAFVTLTDRRPFVAKHLAALFFDAVWASEDDKQVMEDLQTSFAGMLARRFVGTGQDFAEELRKLDAVIRDDWPASFIDLFGGAGDVLAKLWARGHDVESHFSRYAPTCGLPLLSDGLNEIRIHRDHVEAWAEIHRSVEPVCISGQAVDALSRYVLPSHEGDRMLRPEAPFEGFWWGWNRTARIKALRADERPALLLAHKIAGLAASVASSPHHLSSFSPWLKEHRYGGADLPVAPTTVEGVPEAEDAGSGKCVGDEVLGKRRAAAGGSVMAVETASCRDRLLVFMKANGLTVPQLIALKLPALQVDGGSSLRAYGADICLDDQAESDLWRLVHRAGTSQGWLFSQVDAPYGSEPLTTGQVDHIVTLARRAADDAPGGRADMRRGE